MLHAFNQGKSTLYRDYLYRNEREGRVNAEDELTALLLGPLDLLRPEDTALFWHTLLKQLKAHDYQPDSLPSQAKMYFWRREKGIEPDLVVELYWTDSSKIDLLVELKWRSPLSGHDQLRRQWLEYFSDQQRQTGYHLFIAPETSAAATARNSEQGDVWQGRLLEVSWFKLMSFFTGLPVTSPLKPWANQVSQTLQKLNIRSFQGFKSHLKPVPHNQPDYSHLFWRGFIGFQSLPLQVPQINYPLFFTLQEQNHG